jgi:gliding motility-associated-like protein
LLKYLLTLGNALMNNHLLMSGRLFSGKYFFLLAFIFMGSHVFGQLSNFTLTVTAVNETCTANGSLSFTATNTTAGATVIYRIYKLPNVTTPITVTNANTFGGLSAGTYSVEAIQSLGNLSNTQQQNIQITNMIIPVTFQIAGQPAPYCGTTGSMTVNVDHGTPVNYEIISGPLLFPLQASNVFTGLVPGDYVVRVIDACGDGVVQTYHLPVPPPNLTIALQQNCTLIDCNTKSVSITVTAALNTQIGYPLVIGLTVLPAGGQPLNLFQTIASGNASSQNVSFNIPFYNIATCTAFISATDACGNIKEVNGIPLNVIPSMNIGTQAANSCNEEIDLNLCNMLPPYMVTFLSAPAGFIPADFNPNNLGPFNSAAINYVSNAQHEMPEGHYQIRVTDSCGRSVEGGATIVKAFTDHKLVSYFQGCNQQNIVFIPDHGISPVTVVMTSAPAGYDHALPYDVSFNISGGIFSMNLPLLGTYVFTGINVCGDSYTRVVTILPLEPILLATGSVLGCLANTGKVTIDLLSTPPIANVVMTAAPVGFGHALPYDVTSFLVSTSKCVVTGLPVGSYTFVVTDICGTVYPPVSASITVVVVPVVPMLDFLRGCAVGDGSMKMQMTGRKFVQVVITAAPAGYSHPLPYDVSFNIDVPGNFYMNTLPEGNYIFHIKDDCGAEQDLAFVLPGNDILQNDITVAGNCGSFNLIVFHRLGPPVVHGLWLQKLNPLTGQWGHPITGSPYLTGSIPTITDSLFLINETTTYNIASTGSFRVLKYNIIYSNGRPQLDNCFTVIKEFVFTGELTIDSASAFSCSNSTNDVIITVTGIPPFTYKITSKNGIDFLVDNGNSNAFLGLAPAIYNFQVQDLCGNIANRLFDITSLPAPTILPDNLCVGQNAQLSVPAVSYLSYQWWNGSNPTVILSTTNALHFTPFSNTTTPGTYYVRIYSTSNLSCINKTISYTILPTPLPNAGQDGNAIFCGNSGTVDLFSLLGTPFTANGIWTETSTSGALAANIWTMTGLPYDTYTFEYTVSNDCGNSDDAIVTIHLNEIPETPVIHTDPLFCGSEQIQLHADPIAGAAIQWSGPNGFSSVELNPIVPNNIALNNGIYTATASANGCESNASLVLALQPEPLYLIQSSCSGGNFTVSVKPIADSFDVESVTYSWTGPSGFTSSENPIQVTGLPPGLYEVTVMTASGCQTTQSVRLSSTVCGIPNVITPNNDSTNDTFDLSALDVDRIEIYSRWGRLVYEQNNYEKEWYGQNMHGKELPDSTYYYILYLRSGEEKQGYVYKFSWSGH